ncbi:MAG: flagellar hook-associated protein FlgL [Candidatus Eremiobacteraeota bacterium]|nr:flagellar hook-associated protein FlgL [Candidatus Eremiobacteraeota bacterium]
MRIATSTLYDQQTAAIDNTLATQANFANQLSTGKQLNQPSDDPTQIARDLLTRNEIGVTQTSDQNVNNSIGELTTTESTLASLGSVIQSARQLAIQAATDTVSPAQRQNMANTVDQLIQQGVALANTTYAGKYIFGGTASSSIPPLTTQGVPITAVTFTGNAQGEGQFEANGEQLSLSTTLQKAFNFNAADGSLNVFQMLLNLRNTLNGQLSPISVSGSGTAVNAVVVDQSATSVAAPGAVVSATAPLGGQSAAFGVPLNVGGPISFVIDGATGSSNITVNPATDSIDAPSSGGGTSIVTAINAASGVTGVTATWDERTQRLTLASGNPFHVTDVTGNFTSAFGLSGQGDIVNDLSRQLNDIDNVFTRSVDARSQVGASIQTLTALKDQFNTSITNETATQSQIEDADIPSTYSKYAQAQTTLQSAYLTTTRLEAKTLFDYL